ncbi:hypothetical protein [Streptomyces sp. NPDC052042]|uniref:hypothetical protein n=1 Tax=Streptomyces sp. NPDC052042 TaxID=3365683 RepID=UPI0037D2C6FE
MGGLTARYAVRTGSTAPSAAVLREEWLGMRPCTDLTENPSYGRALRGFFGPDHERPAMAAAP